MLFICPCTCFKGYSHVVPIRLIVHYRDVFYLVSISILTISMKNVVTSSSAMSSKVFTWRGSPGRNFRPRVINTCLLSCANVALLTYTNRNIRSAGKSAEHMEQVRIWHPGEDEGTKMHLSHIPNVLHRGGGRVR